MANLSFERPRPKRPSPSVIGEPSPLKQRLDALAATLADAQQQIKNLRLGDDGATATVRERFEVVAPVLDALADTVTTLADDQFVREIQERNGITPSEALQIASAEQVWRKIDARQR